MKKLKLTIELVPKALWGANPRLAMGRTRWDKIRLQVYADYGHRCGICGAEGRLEAHELWEYDDANLVQRLAGLIALCVPCHQIKHLGRSGILAADGKVDIDALRSHFLAVNACTLQEFDDHVKAGVNIWKQRSAQQGWSVDWGPFHDLIPPSASVHP